MTLPEAYKTQVQHIQESYKFQPSGESRVAVSFPGYTLITSTATEDSENSAFYATLQGYQQEILQLPGNKDLIVPLPAGSFHLTLADLIWDSAYRHACEENPQFDQQLRSCIAETFQQYQESLTKESQGITWKVLGIVLMPRAIGVCLVPKDENCYEQIIKFRRTVYQNPKLIALGIEQHYHFTAHVTLGYFGAIPEDLDRIKFVDSLTELNKKWMFDLPEISISRVELRKFDDMTRYYREPDWPILKF